MNNKLLPLALTSLVAGLGLLLTTIALALVPSAPNADLSSTLAGPLKTDQDNTVWNSGWFTLTPGTVSTLSHNLGGDPRDYVVDVTYIDANTPGLGINTRAFGGLERSGDYQGVVWQNLTSDAVEIFRYPDDVYADLIYLQVMAPDEGADYCSAWTPISPTETLTFSHNLGGDGDDLVAALTFSGTMGITRRAYGGLEDDGAYHGAYWSNLTSSTVQVTRHADDTFAQQVQVCINQVDSPDFDSGWRNIGQGVTQTVQHNLRWNPRLLRVRLDYQDAEDYGINHYAAGGMAISNTLVGADWHHLTGLALQVSRRPDDTVADQIRVRIWQMGSKVYLPIVARAYAPPTELAHDDGTLDSTDSWEVDKGFAVCFSPGWDSAQLQTARYYLQQPTTIEVHVWDAASHDDLITPFETTPTQDGWNEVDLSGQSLTVTGDFCLGFLHTVDYQPSIGVDTSSDGHSYEVDGGYWELQGNEYMIRAVLVP